MVTVSEQQSGGNPEGVELEINENERNSHCLGNEIWNARRKKRKKKKENMQWKVKEIGEDVTSVV